MTESADMQYLHDQAEQMARQMTEMVDGLIQPFRELARNLNAVLEGLPSVEVTVPEALSGPLPAPQEERVPEGVRTHTSLLDPAWSTMTDAERTDRLDQMRRKVMSWG